MGPKLTVKRGDKHDVRLTVVNAPLDMASGVATVHVTPSTGGTATTFPGVIDGDDVIWSLDGSLAVGRYKLEVQITVGLFVMTAPNDDWMELVVLQDLA